ncbi:response regulator [Bacteroides faecis]|nr:response regulator [Bacteroides faecis]
MIRQPWERSLKRLSEDASGSVSGNTEEGCSEGSSADASPSQQTILIAEDEDSNFDLLKAILGRKYRLIRARDGMEAVMSYDEAKPDLILMDIKMPNLDGLEATKIIRELSTTVPIIAQSAYAYQQDQIAAMDVGCNDFIAKPISQAKLKDMINKWLP